MTSKNRFDDGYWAVEYDAAEQMFTVRSLDQHLVPLNLPLSEVIRLADGTVRGPAAPPEGEPRVGINRKEKSLYIVVPEGWSGLLKIPRKELYQYGKMMGRRGKGKIKK